MTLEGSIVVAASYLIGGIPFGYIFYRGSRGGDIRSVGSGNIGATNVSRSAGWTLGALTLLLDALKGAAGVLIARAVTGGEGWAAAAALAAVAGHCFPIYLAFRGGKGVATGLGSFVFLDPAAMGIALAGFITVLGFSRIVALGSIVAALLFPAAAWAFGRGAVVGLCSAAAALLIVARHHENIRRMIRGEEGRMWGHGSREKA